MAYSGAWQIQASEGPLQDPTLQEIREKQRQELSVRRKQQVFENLSSKRRWIQQVEPQSVTLTKEQLAVLSNKLKRFKDVSVLQQLNKAVASGSQQTIDDFLSVDRALRVLVDCLRSEDEDLQSEATACIINLSMGEHSSTMRIITASAPYLIVYLDGGNTALKNLSAWALGNMAADCEKCCQMLQAQGFPLAMCRLLESPHEDIVASACFALACYTLTADDKCCREVVTSKTMAFFAECLQEARTSSMLTSEIAKIMFHLSCRGYYDEEFLQSGIITVVINKLAVLASEEPDNLKILTPLIRALGNLAAGQNVNALTSNPCLATLVQLLLQSRYNHLRKETLWFLANLTGGGQTAAAFVCNVPGVLQRIIQMTDVIGEIGTQALICLCNLSAVDKSYCDAIISQNPYLEIEHVLKGPDADSLMLAMTLLLQLFGNSQNPGAMESCLQVLHVLQYHSMPQISTMAAHLIDRMVGF